MNYENENLVKTCSQCKNVVEHMRNECMNNWIEIVLDLHILELICKMILDFYINLKLLNPTSLLNVFSFDQVATSLPLTMQLNTIGQI